MTRVGLVTLDSEGATFQVRVTPRAGRDEVGPVVDGLLRIRVTAPPIEGEANEAVIELLARVLEVPSRAVQIIAGSGGRRKTVRVIGAPRPLVEKLFFRTRVG
jgi:uncharacterized protein